MISKTSIATQHETVSKGYGRAFREFYWSYKIDALPQPVRGRRHGVKPVAPSESAQENMFRLVIEELTLEQGNPVTHVYAIETGREGFRHVHALLGNISRLTPEQVVACFRANGFGKTNVELWSRNEESGYCMKTVDSLSYVAGSDTSQWDFALTWNRKIKQQMKLNRRHLERLLFPQQRRGSSGEIRRLLAAAA